MTNAFVVGLAAGLALIPAANSLPAQEDHGSHRTGLGAVIDGSKKPELIPEMVAWLLYFRAVAEPADATPERQRALRAKLSPLGLSAEDFEVCRNVLAAFYAEIRHSEERIRAIGRVEAGSPAYEEVVSLRKATDRLAGDTRALLEVRLSPGGAERLRRQVHDSRRDMKVVPVIPAIGK